MNPFFDKHTQSYLYLLKALNKSLLFNLIVQSLILIIFYHNINITLKMSVFSISIYVGGSPLIIENKEPYHFKHVMDLNEQALTFLFLKNLKASAYYKPNCALRTTIAH